MVTGYIPNINKFCGNPDGSIRVHEEKCSNCPFRKGSAFGPQMKTIIERLKSTTNGMLCHQTYFPEDLPGAICRGGYDIIHSKAEPDTKITFVPVPTNPVQVEPYNGPLSVLIGK